MTGHRIARGRRFPAQVWLLRMLACRGGAGSVQTAASWSAPAGAGRGRHTCTVVVSLGGRSALQPQPPWGCPVALTQRLPHVCGSLPAPPLPGAAWVLTPLPRGLVTRASLLPAGGWQKGRCRPALALDCALKARNTLREADLGAQTRVPEPEGLSGTPGQAWRKPGAGVPVGGWVGKARRAPGGTASSLRQTRRSAVPPPPGIVRTEGRRGQGRGLFPFWFRRPSAAWPLPRMFANK